MVDAQRWTPTEAMRGEDQRETAELHEMHSRAREYLESHRWCREIVDARLGFGVGGVVAVFLFLVRIYGVGMEHLWVIEGDLPSAYLVTDDAADPAAALELYADLMSDWIAAVRSGTGLDHVFPVSAPADEAHASLLETRVRLLREMIVPACRER